MSDVTQVLGQIESGDGQAAEKLLPLVYDELRKLAAQRMTRENPGQTLQATALVHEAYLRLVDVKKAQHWDSCGHFFAAAAEAMRRILVDNARRKDRVKHGGGMDRVSLNDVVEPRESQVDDILALDEALKQLAEEDSIAAELVKLRYFSGLNIEQAGSALGMSPRTAYRNWAFARAWLFRRLNGSDSTS